MFSIERNKKIQILFIIIFMLIIIITVNYRNAVTLISLRQSETVCDENDYEIIIDHFLVFKSLMYIQ